VQWEQTFRRTEGLEVNQLPDGYVIYQQQADRVHYLNRTAVLVFELCDGTVPARDIPEMVREAYDLGSPPMSEVEECLTRFVDEGLVEAI
jgi:hypothetical protein